MRRGLIRNVRVDGRLVDIAVEGECIVAIGEDQRGEELFDARGGAGIPGLHDHHIHLLATAAMMDSVRLDECADAADLTRTLRQADRDLPAGAWLRATGYHERIAGPIDRDVLDRIVPTRPVRMQHQTGGLWMLNGAGLDRIAGDGWPDAVERDDAGRPNGRIVRGDRWLGGRIGPAPPDLAALGRRLAGAGITGVADASVTNDASSAALLGKAVRGGSLPLRLMLMSGGPLDPPADDAYAIGPVKILIDDDRLPSIDDLVACIRQARRWRRAVAVHCVTAGELAVTLAALEEAGALPGDRIEHGSIVPAAAIPTIAAMGLTVVTQPGFVATRGDRYRALVDPAEQADLYRCASLIAAGIGVAGSSDAPYGPPDPWIAIRTAIGRRTPSGAALGLGERIAAARALDLFLGPLDAPAGAVRRLRVGAPADLCVLHGPLADMMTDAGRQPVAATLCRGRITHRG